MALKNKTKELKQGPNNIQTLFGPPSRFCYNWLPPPMALNSETNGAQMSLGCQVIFFFICSCFLLLIISVSAAITHTLTTHHPHSTEQWEKRAQSGPNQCLDQVSFFSLPFFMFLFTKSFLAIQVITHWPLPPHSTQKSRNGAQTTFKCRLGHLL